MLLFGKKRSPGGVGLNFITIQTLEELQILHFSFHRYRLLCFYISLQFYTLKESVESKQSKKKGSTAMPWPVYNIAGGTESKKLMIDREGDTLITDELTDDLLAR